MSNKILEVKNLSKFFISKKGVARAIDDISFDIKKGEVVGLIGESGSGKTTTGNAIMRLLREVNGIIALDGKVISGKMNKKETKDFHRKVQMIFQNPYTALNEKRNIFSTLAEPLKVNKIIQKETSSFLENWKVNVQTFNYSFKIDYYSLELEFNKFKIKNKELAFKKINIALKDAKVPEDLINAIYSPLKEYESLLNTKMAEISEKLIKVYVDGNNRILRGKIFSSERKLITETKKLNDLKEQRFKAKQKVYRELKNIDNNEKKEIKLGRKKTHNLLNDLINDRKQRILFNKRLFPIMEDPISYDKYKNKYKKAITEKQFLIKEVKKLNLISSFDKLNDLDELIFDSKDLNLSKNKLLSEFIANLVKETNYKIKSIKSKYKKLKTTLIKKKNVLTKEREENLDIKIEKVRKKIEIFKKEYTNFLVRNKNSYIKKINELISEINSKEYFYIQKKQLNYEKRLFENFNNKIKIFLEKINDKKKVENLKSIIRIEKVKLESFKKEQKFLVKNLNNTKILLGIKKTHSLYRKLVIQNLLLKRKIFKILKEVGLKAEHAYRYPHEFSGGQLQRVVIARALIVEPDLIIADEPISSLDVSIQAQIINILTSLVKKRKIAMIFIAHDISVIEYIADSMLVMHLGKVVEKGITKKIFSKPTHPYTRSLFDAVPKISNAHKPFTASKVKLNYQNEYLENSPNITSISKDHYVLGNQEQIEKWLGRYVQKSKK